MAILFVAGVLLVVAVLQEPEVDDFQTFKFLLLLFEFQFVLGSLLCHFLLHVLLLLDLLHDLLAHGFQILLKQPYLLRECFLRCVGAEDGVVGIVALVGMFGGLFEGDEFQFLLFGDFDLLDEFLVGFAEFMLEEEDFLLMVAAVAIAVLAHLVTVIILIFTNIRLAQSQHAMLSSMHIAISS